MTELTPQSYSSRKGIHSMRHRKERFGASGMIDARHDSGAIGIAPFLRRQGKSEGLIICLHPELWLWGRFMPVNLDMHTFPYKISSIEIRRSSFFL